MPTRRRTATKRVRNLGDLPDAQYWELILGPSSCDGNRCDRAGHHIPQRLGAPVDDPERPVGKAYYPLRESDRWPFEEGQYRVEPHALCSAWATPEERREVYWSLREELLEASFAGDRVWAWWAIEVGEHPGDQAAWLADHNMLSPAEEGQLLSWSDFAETGSIGVNRYLEAARIIRARRGSEQGAT